MALIEYLYTEGKIGDRNTLIRVRLDGKYADDIKPVDNGWQYFPKGKNQGGLVYKTITEVQRSLKSED